MKKIYTLVCYGNGGHNQLDYMKSEYGFENLDVLVDCGAVKAFKQGFKITLDEYCEFLDKHVLQTPAKYFALDVIENPEATRKNYFEMLRRGYKPIPIITAGSSLEMLNEYYETADLVALGGLAPLRAAKAWDKFDLIMKHIGERKCHWLAFCIPEFISKYKPYSMDSSSWIYASKAGNFHFFIRAGAKLQQYSKVKIAEILGNPKPSPERTRIIASFSRMGVDIGKEWKDSQGFKSFNYRTRLLFGMIPFMQQADFWGEKYNSIYYIVTAAKRQIDMLFESRRMLDADMGYC